MPESSGIVVIQAAEHIFKAFVKDRNQGLEELVEFAKADSAINDDCDVFFETLTIKGDSACFVFEDDYWVETVKRLISSGNNIGLYLHSWDEYGAQLFLAKNPQGDSYTFFAGGPEDDFEIEGGDVVTDDSMKQWLAVIPESIKIAFPQLIKKY